MLSNYSFIAIDKKSNKIEKFYSEIIRIRMV